MLTPYIAYFDELRYPLALSGACLCFSGLVLRVAGALEYSTGGVFVLFGTAMVYGSLIGLPLPLMQGVLMVAIVYFLLKTAHARREEAKRPSNGRAGRS